VTPRKSWRDENIIAFSVWATIVLRIAWLLLALACATLAASVIVWLVLG
jgi:Mg/Co/Ni transporter MgtE